MSTVLANLFKIFCKICYQHRAKQWPWSVDISTYYISFEKKTIQYLRNLEAAPWLRYQLSSSLGDRLFSHHHILKSSLVLRELTSVQQFAPLITLKLSRSYNSRLLQTITKSIKCQCLDQGCCQIPLHLSFCWHQVFPVNRSNSLQSCKSGWPLLLYNQDHGNRDISTHQNP